MLVASATRFSRGESGMRALREGCCCAAGWRSGWRVRVVPRLLVLALLVVVAISCDGCGSSARPVRLAAASSARLPHLGTDTHASARRSLNVPARRSTAAADARRDVRAARPRIVKPSAAGPAARKGRVLSRPQRLPRQAAKAVRTAVGQGGRDESEGSSVGEGRGGG